MDKYRLLTHKEEISSLANKAPVVKKGEIWQSHDERVVYPITDVQVVDEGLIFRTNVAFKLRHEWPIYIRINFRNLIFKLRAHEYIVVENAFICQFPKEAKALEVRKVARTVFPTRPGINLTLRSLSHEMAIDIVVYLENINEKGLGIVTGVSYADHFTRNSHFQIISIAHKVHVEYSILTVRHVSIKKDKLAVGFAADRPFSDGLYRIIREQLKKIKTK
jgi:hypothetical protein